MSDTIVDGTLRTKKARSLSYTDGRNLEKDRSLASRYQTGYDHIIDEFPKLNLKMTPENLVSGWDANAADTYHSGSLLFKIPISCKG